MSIRTVSLLIILVTWLLPCPLLGQNPTLTLFDSEGATYWAPDNTTLFETTPGDLFTLEIAGEKDALFGLYLSLFKTPYPLNVTPPPLLLMPPIFPIVAGPNVSLNPSGLYNISLFVPKEYTTLGHDIDVYVQAFVKSVQNGFELTNGITVRILSPQYKAHVALAQGEALNSIVEFGALVDTHANDNKIPPGGGPGLEGGEPIMPDGDMTPGHIFAFGDDSTPPSGVPDPTTSIYLNGIFPLVPGDTGIDDRILVYPKMGSHLHIYTRDRICRNAENMNLQHIIIPVFDEHGEKTKDMNLYHFRDKTTGEYGFMVYDVLNRDFYELKGTRFPEDDGVSPWDPNVAISPDGMLMAAVLTNRPSSVVTDWKDKLYIIRLGKEDTWSTEDHARKVKINDLASDHWANRIFPESLTFAGAPEPHGLFFVTNRFDSQTGNKNTEPPPEIAAALWSLQAAKEKTAGKYHNFTSITSPFPKASDANYPFVYFGRTKIYSIAEKEPTELKWFRSSDHQTICLRAAGRYAEWNSKDRGWIRGDWAWEIMGITGIEVEGEDFNYEIKNLTKFPETYPENGFEILPFGHASNGWSKAAIGPPDPQQGTVLLAFTAKHYGGTEGSEDLYLAPIDGSLAGSLAPINNPVVFKDLFQNDWVMGIGTGVFDPTFLDHETLVFYFGRNALITGTTVVYAETDLFLYRQSHGEFRNLTETGRDGYFPFHKIEEPTPPFTVFGSVRPSGIFLSPNGRYLFFFHGYYHQLYIEPKKMNLVGIDIEADYRVFDLTGNRYSGGTIPDTDTEKVGSLIWGPECLNMILIPTESTVNLYFTAKWFYKNKPENYSYQVFMVNTEYPIGAFPVTSFHLTDEAGLIDNLVADATGKYLAFSRSDQVVYDGTEGGFEDIYAVDLSLGAFTQRLTGAYPVGSRASIDGSFRFLPAASTKSPAVLIYGMAPGGTASQADNPNDARIWLYPLGDLTNPDVPSYPLTMENQFLLFDAQPVTGR